MDMERAFLAAIVASRTTTRTGSSSPTGSRRTARGVVSIRSKGALVRQMPSTGGEKKWGFIGFAMIVQLEEPKTE
jgi:hypothetical protein